MDRLDDRHQARSRHGQATPVREWQVNRLVVAQWLIAGGVEEGRGDQLADRPDQIDAHAVDHDAEIEFEPVEARGVAKPDLEGAVAAQQPVGKIVIDFDDKTGFTQRRQRVIEEIEPAEIVVLRQEVALMPRRRSQADIARVGEAMRRQLRDSSRLLRRHADDLQHAPMRRPWSRPAWPRHGAR